MNRLFDTNDARIPALSAKENDTGALPSTFKRTGGAKKGPLPPSLNDLESLNMQYGVFERKNEPASPTEVKMKDTAILQNANKSFDQYFQEMRRRK